MRERRGLEPRVPIPKQSDCLSDGTTWVLTENRGFRSEPSLWRGHDSKRWARFSVGEVGEATAMFGCRERFPASVSVENPAKSATAGCETPGVPLIRPVGRRVASLVRPPTLPQAR
jgi:hypothetical protein